MTNHNGSTTLERFIPLSKAARQLALSQSTLHALIDSGKIRAAVLPSGEIGVSEQSAEQAAAYERINELLRTIRRENFRKLRGQPITIGDAAEKYDLNSMTIRGWIEHEYIRILKQGYRMELDEADVAFCAKVYHIRKANNSLSGAPLLDDKGQPNELKHPQLSEYRRRKKTSPLNG